MARLITYLAGIAGSVVLLFYVTNPTAIGVWTGVATALLIPVIDLVITNTRYFRLHLWALLHPTKQVRLSISYLMRVQINGSYLLVRGHRYPGQFQPIGGVYKFRSSIKGQFSKWRVRTDSLIPIDEVSSEDLRIRVPSRNMVAVLRWFETGENREVGIWREFYEELVQAGIVKSENFWNLEFEKIRMHIEPVRFSRQADSYELLIADVFDVTLTNEQSTILRSASVTSNDLGLFTEEQIRRGGAEPGLPDKVSIPPTAEWTL